MVFNYKNLLELLQNVIPSAVVDTKMDKSLLMALLGLCQSHRERESIRYAVFKASGFTSTQAHTQFGFQNMTQRAKNVEDSLSHAHYIRTAIEKLAVTTEKAVLCRCGEGYHSSLKQSRPTCSRFCYANEGKGVAFSVVFSKWPTKEYCVCTC